MRIEANVQRCASFSISHRNRSFLFFFKPRTWRNIGLSVSSEIWSKLHQYQWLTYLSTKAERYIKTRHKRKAASREPQSPTHRYEPRTLEDSAAVCSVCQGRRARLCRVTPSMMLNTAGCAPPAPRLHPVHDHGHTSHRDLTLQWTLGYLDLR